jgi:hypothetical protein
MVISVPPFAAFPAVAAVMGTALGEQWKSGGAATFSFDRSSAIPKAQRSASRSCAIISTRYQKAEFDD